jgi:hypothetical protein
MIGTTVGKYRIVARLGRGGMGTVYRAIDETLDREVAIKVLNSEVADAKLMARFRAEATMLAKLNHPEIATIYEIYQTETDLLMVMELVRGETLDQLSVRVGPLAPDRAAYLAAQVLNGLGHAHRAGIVHRDLKPANVMVTESGAVKIMDFGIARVLGAEHMTSDGTMMGTPAYMAPEQVLGKDVDARADLYSVGVVFYRLLTGCLPFQADTPIGMVQKQLWDPPTPARSYRADLPDWCEAILTRALTKSPTDRFQSADEFRSALFSAIAISPASMGPVAASQLLKPILPGTATPIGGLTPAELAVAPTATMVRAPATESRHIDHAGGHIERPSRRALVIGAAAAAAMLLIVVAIVAGRRATNTDTPAPPSAVIVADASTAADTTLSTTPASTLDAAVVPTSADASAVDAANRTAVPVATDGAGTTPTPPKPAPAPPKPVVTAVTPSASVATEAATAPPATAETSASTEPAAPEPPAALVLPPVAFSAQTVVFEGGKNRQRDTNVQVANGVITVTGKDNKLVVSVPLEQVVGVTYSNSRQPMWNTPQGPAEIAHLDGGAFGFLRGDQHWVSLRTDAMSLVMRVREQDSRRVIAAIEERTGKKVERVGESKGR